MLTPTHSESSLFVSPHRLILKTCGTTLNLMGLPRILEIAREHEMPNVYRCFYSRKSFFFPELQNGPHREWRDEVEYLDGYFQNGAAYSVGKMNGDHWLLYITRPPECTPNTPPPVNRPLVCAQTTGVNTHRTLDARPVTPDTLDIDSTIEILMTGLSPSASSAFNFPGGSDLTSTPFERAAEVSSRLGITDLFPPDLTTLNSYAFTPCGYSANALLKWGEATDGHDTVPGGEGYYTIHVTPEEGWSYASFECNVPLSPVPAPRSGDIPDLVTLLRSVVNIFRPARLTLTLFISSAGNDETEEEVGESAVEAAQRAFKAALTSRVGDGQTDTYKRSDKINYDFGDYDLAFASFELAT
jgi:S-adenosylmethionine decarboxylase